MLNRQVAKNAKKFEPQRRRGAEIRTERFSLFFLRVLGVLVVQLFFLLVAPASTHAANPIQIFLMRDVDGTTQDRLTFIDVLTGAETQARVDGERYTPVRDGVLFYNRTINRMRLATPDGFVFDHPTIQPTLTARRIDWAVSPDREQIAWTVTEGSGNALVTTTWVGDAEGGNARQVLVDGPRDGIRIMPVTLNAEGTILYVDYQPDTIGDLTPFRDYAGLYALDLATGDLAPMPGEPGCFCGAGIHAGQFVRLGVAPNLSGFEVRLHDLTIGRETTIRALNLVGFTQAGDVLIAPGGDFAVYGLAQITDFGTDQQSIETVFVLVDLMAGTQTTLTQPIPSLLRPAAWTEDHSAILFTSPTENGTWKIIIPGGGLEKVANATYVGSLG